MSLTNQISGVFTMKTFHCNIAAISSLALIRNRMQRARRRSQRTRNQPLESLEQRVLMTATGVSQLMQDSPEDQAGQPVLNNQSGNNQAGKGTGEAVLQTPAEKKAAKKAGKHIISIDVTAGSSTNVSLSDHVPTIITQRGKESMVYDITGIMTIKGKGISAKVERIKGTTTLVVTGVKQGTAEFKVRLQLNQAIANQALNPLDRRGWSETKIVILKVTVKAKPDSSKLSDSGQVRSPGERVDSRSVEEIASDVDRTLSEETGRKTAIVTSPFDAVREDRQRAVRIVSRVDQPAAENTVTDRFEESGKAFSRPVIQQTGVREAAVLNQVFASLTDGLLD
jgi:hypothetical protein